MPRQYVDGCPNAIAGSEELARSKSLGIWSGDYQLPWDYRAKN
ncbi:MAG: hypothetical protein AAF959_19165 [Cyanobacteria bacterium P01_D01_bin.56]